MRIVRSTDEMIASNNDATPNAILSLSAIGTGALIVTGILAAFA